MNENKSLLTWLGEAIDGYRAEQQRSRAQLPHSQSSSLRRILSWFVPNGGTLLLIAVLLFTQNVWARSTAAPVAPGPSATTVNYQGRLADPSGTPLDGTYGMSFSLWDAATDGNLIWGPESHSAVPVSDGLFSVGLGSQTSGGIPTSVWDGDRYLEITVGGETLEPREVIRSVPIAGMALTALTVPDGAIGTDQIANGAVTSDKLAATSWNVNGSGYWDTSITEEYVAVPEIEFLFTPSTDGVILLNLSTLLKHSTTGAEVYCGIGVNDLIPARSAVYFSSSNKLTSCTTNLVYSVQAGQSYQFSLMVYADRAGTLRVHKDYFTQLSAIFLGSP